LYDQLNSGDEQLNSTLACRKPLYRVETVCRIASEMQNLLIVLG
jgi:hypothetical protein